MKVMPLTNSALIVCCALMLGCQNDKVHCRNYPNKYQFVKEIENQVLSLESTNAFESIRNYGKMPPMPDYFDFGRAVEA